MIVSRFNAPSMRAAEGASARLLRLRSAHLAGLAVLLVFVALALNSAATVPLFEASDEAAHFLYIHSLAESGTLPVIPTRSDLDLAAQAGNVVAQWSVESHQPPLYYAFAAVLIAPIDRSDISDLLQSNDLVFTWGLRAGNPNQWLHAPDIALDKTVRAVWIVRLFSLALACGTLWCIYRASALATGSLPLALTAMLATASIPTFAAISASVNNDNLVTLLSAAAVWWTLRMLRFGLRRYDWGIIALLMSAVALTKFTGLSVGLVVVAGLWLARRKGTITRTQALTVVGAMAGAVAINAGWWYLRNVELYGDPLALDATQALWGRTFAVASESGGLIAEVPRIWQSFWLMIGHLHQPVWGPPWLYVAALGLVAASGVGWLCTIARRSYRVPIEPGSVLLLAAILPAVMLIVGTGSVDISYGRLLFPGLVGIVPLLAIGWRGLTGRFAVLFALPLLVMTALMPYTTIRPAYSRLESLAGVPPSAVPLNLQIEGSDLQLLGFEPLPRTIHAGDAPPLTVYLTGSDSRRPALTVTWLSPRTAENLGQMTVYPGMTPTDALTDQAVYRAVVPTAPLFSGCESLDTCDSGTGLLRVQLKWQTDGFTILPTVNAAGDPAPVLFDGPVFVQAEPSSDSSPVAAEFGSAISLYSPDIDLTDSVLKLSLNWRIDAVPPADLTATVQIFDADGVFITNVDGDIEGYPARVWIPGTTVSDLRRISLPEGLAPGRYTVAIGWYARGDLIRLSATADTVRDNLAVIGTFEVL